MDDTFLIRARKVSPTRRLGTGLRGWSTVHGASVGSRSESPPPPHDRPPPSAVRGARHPGSPRARSGGNNPRRSSGKAPAQLRGAKLPRFNEAPLVLHTSSSSSAMQGALPGAAFRRSPPLGSLRGAVTRELPRAPKPIFTSAGKAVSTLGEGQSNSGSLFASLLAEQDLAAQWARDSGQEGMGSGGGDVEIPISVRLATAQAVEADLRRIQRDRSSARKVSRRPIPDQERRRLLAAAMQGSGGGAARRAGGLPMAARYLGNSRTQPALRGLALAPSSQLHRLAPMVCPVPTRSMNQHAANALLASTNKHGLLNEFASRTAAEDCAEIAALSLYEPRASTAATPWEVSIPTVLGTEPANPWLLVGGEGGGGGDGGSGVVGSSSSPRDARAYQSPSPVVEVYIAHGRGGGGGGW